MKSVLKFLKNQEWAPALVGLWVLASDTRTLIEWERNRDSAGGAARVQDFQARLEIGKVPALREASKWPLDLIQAVDLLLWAGSGPTKHFAKPYLDESSGRSVWLWRASSSERRNTPMNRQAGALAAWFRYHMLAPAKTSQNISVRVTLAEGILGAEVSRAAKDMTHLPVWVAHFTDGCVVQWVKAGGTGRLRAQGLDQDETRTKAMLSTLKRAIAAGAKVIVMPELSLDLPMRRRLMIELERLDPSTAPYVVVPGSFHEDEASGCFNTAPLIDGCAAQELFKHRKLRVFGTVGQGGAPDVAEDIGVGGQFQILVTELGAFGILICKDFLDLDMQVNSLLQEVPVDWVLVPSYGDLKTRRAHLRRAKEIAFTSVGCNVVLANIRNTGFGPGGHLPGFVHSAGQKLPTKATPRGTLVRMALPKPPDPPPESGDAQPRPALKRIK